MSIASTNVHTSTVSKSHLTFCSNCFDGDGGNDDDGDGDGDDDNGDDDDDDDDDETMIA